MQHGLYTDRGLPEGDWRCPSWDPMPDGKRNVLVLGCSHTWGVGLEPNETWVHHVSQHNADKLRYWNLGQPGASADKIVRILYGTEKLFDPKVIIVCWPIWTRRERLDFDPKDLTNADVLLANENDDTDKNNFLKNIFFVEKFAEKNKCKTFHCFAEDSYHELIPGLQVLETYTLSNCWPYWNMHTQRVPHKQPSLARDGLHYGIEHHKRFAELFLEKFSIRLK
tara:strand:+ start:9501 stop:10172 length:672 start_codon:yes stop_codon:yes gene_type:complete